MSINARQFPIDLTGKSARNLIQNETRNTSSDEQRIFVPSGGVYFTESFVMFNGTSGARLRPDIDYRCVHLSNDASMASGKQCCCVVMILNKRIPSVKFTYQVIGGHYSDTIPTLRQILEGTDFNSLTKVSWGTQIYGKPETFPAAAHRHPGSEFGDWKRFHVALTAIYHAIINKTSGAWSSVYAYIDATYNDAINRLNNRMDNEFVNRTEYVGLIQSHIHNLNIKIDELKNEVVALDNVATDTFNTKITELEKKIQSNKTLITEQGVTLDEIVKLVETHHNKVEVKINEIIELLRTRIIPNIKTEQQLTEFIKGLIDSGELDVAPNPLKTYVVTVTAPKPLLDPVNATTFTVTANINTVNAVVRAKVRKPDNTEELKAVTLTNGRGTFSFSPPANVQGGNQLEVTMEAIEVGNRTLGTTIFRYDEPIKKFSVTVENPGTTGIPYLGGTAQFKVVASRTDVSQTGMTLIVKYRGMARYDQRETDFTEIIERRQFNLVNGVATIDIPMKVTQGNIEVVAEVEGLATNSTSGTTSYGRNTFRTKAPLPKVTGRITNVTIDGSPLGDDIAGKVIMTDDASELETGVNYRFEFIRSELNKHPIELRQTFEGSTSTTLFMVNELATKYSANGSTNKGESITITLVDLAYPEGSNVIATRTITVEKRYNGGSVGPLIINTQPVPETSSAFFDSNEQVSTAERYTLSARALPPVSNEDSVLVAKTGDIVVEVKPRVSTTVSRLLLIGYNHTDGTKHTFTQPLSFSGTTAVSVMFKKPEGMKDDYLYFCVIDESRSGFARNRTYFETTPYKAKVVTPTSSQLATSFDIVNASSNLTLQPNTTFITQGNITTFDLRLKTGQVLPRGDIESVSVTAVPEQTGVMVYPANNNVDLKAGDYVSRIVLTNLTTLTTVNVAVKLHSGATTFSTFNTSFKVS